MPTSPVFEGSGRLLATPDLFEEVLTKTMIDLEVEGQWKPEIERCGQSFIHFSRYWQFTARDTGAILSMANMWPGQQTFAQAMETYRWIFALKAGKLGFTELECAYDAWAAMFAQERAIVHIFSKNGESAQEILDWVRFGIRHLPEWMRPVILDDIAGADTQKSIKFAVPWSKSIDDVRQIRSFNTDKSVAIDRVSTHAHVDELSHMLHAEKVWGSIVTTIAEGGSCHIVTRGAGDHVYTAQLWRAAKSGSADLGNGRKIHPVFVNYTGRPGRDEAWRTQEAQNMTPSALRYFAPETDEDAISGEDTEDFIPIDLWDRCEDRNLPPLIPGDMGTKLVVAMDAATTGDCFAVVVTSRHPNRPNDPAIRAVRIWEPSMFSDKRIDYSVVERWIRTLCLGGCTGKMTSHGIDVHPVNDPDPSCPACNDPAQRIPRHNVICLVYDPFQLENMTQRLRKESVAWCEPFPQMQQRLQADRQLRDVIVEMRLSHNGDPVMRQHIRNSRAKIQIDDNSKLRIVKKTQDLKIDGAVAASMAVYQTLYLRL